MELPFCLVDYILRYAGAYHWNQKERPYITELQMLRDILPEQGVQAAVLHLKEFHALKHAYIHYSNNPLVGLYPDAVHLLR